MTDIQFGEVEYQGPEQSLRPDQDAHFAVVACGAVDGNDLPIYVDLDVMRDMEEHARTNTDVELGGVMLGGQFIDDEGNPFVLVTDSLRADHYEATKGSFKFTHETWEDITRRRDEYSKDLQMVGWYHTHPDWGVFLSGMDLFICNNFFNRPLDIALVIDPCRDDRGWFQWTDQDPPTTRETGAFYLVTNRYRADELNFYKALYAGEAPMATDPRYSGMGGSIVQPVVNINDQRTPVQNIAIMGMLTIQLLVLALIGYKLLADDESEKKNEIAALDAKLEIVSQTERLRAREAAYGQVITALTNGSADSQELVQRMVDYESANAQLKANLNGQMALASAAEQQRDTAMAANKDAEEQIDQLENNLTNTQNRLIELEDYKKQKELEDGEGAIPDWLYYLGFALTAVLGIAGGFWLGNQDFGKKNRERHKMREEEEDEFEENQEDF